MPGPLSRGKAWVERILKDGVPEVATDSVNTDKINNDEINVSKKVREGEYSDIVAAIAGEADDQTTLKIEPGVYNPTTTATLTGFVALQIKADGTPTWRFDANPKVKIESSASTLFTIEGNSQGVTFEGINFDGLNTGNTAVFLDASTTNIEKPQFKNCRFESWNGRPVDYQNDGAVQNVICKECDINDNDLPLTLPQGSRWYGGRMSSRDGGFGLEIGKRAQVYGLSADIEGGSSGVKVGVDSTVQPQNLETFNGLGDVGIEADRGCNVSGRVIGFDVGVQLGDGGQAEDMYVNALGMRGNTHDVKIMGTNTGDHNGSYILVKYITSITYDSNASKQHDYIIDAVGGGFNEDPADIEPGMRFFDRGNSRFYMTSRSGLYYFTPDGQV